MMFGGFGHGYGMFGGFGRGYGYGLFGGYGSILFFIIVGVILFFLIRRNRHACHSTQSNFSKPSLGNDGNDAVEIVKARYARGEINQEEYKKILKEIK